MQNSYCFFENRECEYFPCHKGLDEFNCLFCYCPMYAMHCLGTPSYKEINGRVIKVCSECIYPHVPDHYASIMEKLKKGDDV